MKQQPKETENIEEEIYVDELPDLDEDGVEIIP